MENKKFGRKLKAYMPLSARGWLVYFMAMAVASTVCVLLRRISTTDVHVPLIFVLAVLVVALMTDGYFYGILAALTSVVTVNYAFTYPYAKMDFSIYGSPDLYDNAGRGLRRVHADVPGAGTGAASDGVRAGKGPGKSAQSRVP